MSNDVLFIIQTLVSLCIALFAFKMGRIWLIALIAVYAVMMNVFVVKQMTLFGLDVTGGNVLYATIFLSTDLLAEHFGKKEALKAVKVGFFASLVFLVMSQIVMMYVPNSFDFAQSSFATLFTLTPRIVLGSLLAYIVSQHLDVYLFEWIKGKTKGKFLWLRNNASTWISQAVDTVIFTFVGLYMVEINGVTYGVLGGDILWQAMLFTYIIKVIVAAIDTPFIYLSKLEIMKPEDANRTLWRKFLNSFKCNSGG
ncbi:MAG: queuosine precursor transporter [Patescibacteria group bacterium]|nr:queuosine precursor transporter [Patescibacteria group bacterium]